MVVEDPEFDFFDCFTSPSDFGLVEVNCSSGIVGSSLGVVVDDVVGLLLLLLLYEVGRPEF